MTDRISTRLSQLQLQELSPNSKVLRMQVFKTILFFGIGFLFISIIGASAGYLGGSLFSAIGFNYEGSRYAYSVCLLTFLYGFYSLENSGILASIAKSIGSGFFILPIVYPILAKIEPIANPIIQNFGLIYFNSIFTGFTILSIVTIAVICQVLQQDLVKLAPFLQGILIIFMAAIATIAAFRLSQGGWLLPGDIKTLPPNINEWAVSGALAWTAIVVVGGLRLSAAMTRSTPRWLWLRQACTAIAAWGGTSFYNLDLSGIDFSGASIANTDFRGKTLYRTRLLGVSGLDRARVDDRYLDLDRPEVQKLLTAGSATSKNFRRVNLQGAFLQNTDLQGFNFTEANLHDADLKGANLRGAIFLRTRVSGVDFSEADLTGCCIKDWSPNIKTIFTDVICSYIYREFADGRPSDRYPRDRDFEPGEFATLQHHIDNSTELVFQGVTDLRALSFAFEKFKLEDDGLDLELQGIEQRGDLWIVKVSHREGISRHIVEEQVNSTYDDLKALFEARYQLALDAKEGEIARLAAYNESQQVFIQGLVAGVVETHGKVLIQGEGNRVYMVQQAGDIMERQNIKATGNVDASSGAKVSIGGDVTGATLNLGTISGNVTNLLQQLRDSQIQGTPDFAQILGDLQSAIESETQLSPPQKQEALEAVETLAEEAKKPPENRTTKLCTMAMNALKGATGTLSDASKLAEVIKSSLPILKGLLGMV